jgi:signal transduction histidine kinase
MSRRLSLVLALLLTSAPRAHPEARPQGKPGILVLSVDDVSANYLRLLMEGFLRVTRSQPSPPEVYFESLDALRFEGPLYLESVRNWLTVKYAGRDIELIVAVTEGALEFLAAESGAPWPDVPVLYVNLAVEAPDALEKLPFAGGILLEDIFIPSLTVAKKVLPQSRQVVLAYGGSEVARARNARSADLVRAANLDLEPIVWADLPLSTMLGEAERLPRGSLVFLLGPYVDDDGRVLTGRQMCETFSTRTSVALFTPVAYDLGCGVVGGLMLDMSLVGEILAEEALARLVAPSTDVVSVPFARFTRLAFDERQLLRWDVPESRLPAGSAVLYREPNLWRDRRALVVGTIAVTLAQALLITGLVIERRRRIRAEREGRRSLATMAHLDRRAAMGELAASLAHEINQPLNAILQNAGVAHALLTRSPGEPPLDEVQEILEDIQSDDARAGDVIRRMRALLEKRELHAETLDANGFVRDTIDLVRPDAASRGIHVDAALGEGLAPIRGDRVHLQQVLLNLLMNAMDSVAGLPSDRRRLSVATAETNGHVEVSVRDRGAGIADEHLSHVFEAFYTTKGKGLGMGLAISKGIVDAHGGRIGAENHPGGGARVWFRVPAGTSR